MKKLGKFLMPLGIALVFLITSFSVAIASSIDEMDAKAYTPVMFTIDSAGVGAGLTNPTLSGSDSSLNTLMTTVADAQAVDIPEAGATNSTNDFVANFSMTDNANLMTVIMVDSILLLQTTRDNEPGAVSTGKKRGLAPAEIVATIAYAFGFETIQIAAA
ncbi:hypothetical protein HOC76_03200 [bacterium]|nr:hypothetical protein [bacterium]